MNANNRSHNKGEKMNIQNNIMIPKIKFGQSKRYSRSCVGKQQQELFEISEKFYRKELTIKKDTRKINKEKIGVRSRK